MSSNYATGFSLVTILMLDDDPAMRAVVRTILREAGCKDIVQTGNGHDALDILSQRRIDLVLCDCQMAAMDGMTFLRRLRDRPDGADIPVIMLTASRDQRDAWEAQQLKAAAWLVKPVLPQALAGHVASALGMAPPRLRDDALASLAESYEARLPQEIALLEATATKLLAGGTLLEAQLQGLLHRLHIVKGQGGTLGYPLLSDIAAHAHDVLRLVLHRPEAGAPHQEEVVKLVSVCVASMKLVAERKLRGEGGVAGEKLRGQLGAFAGALQAKLAAVADTLDAEARRARDDRATRLAEAEANGWMLKRRIELDTK
ncbi:response regulator [Plastoroseomonas hellenica]|uniref:Response regulator n=1 Tax=Plastoroseomonas hellenica TaxID=2687306 RepID=A0ABS5EUC3_9PROT|nr:response regulator [Plastoroseomonas hellenica]MBR0641573.1 response regulator [Plastoroseomonas hellenica]MBR0663880.1 response regulator [Plastoroseomonas hellenica]